jgi:hypothetical protein
LLSLRLRRHLGIGHDAGGMAEQKSFR